MLFVIVALMVLTFMFFAFKMKNVALSIISAFGFAGLGIQQLTAYYSYASITGMEPLIGYTCALLCICMFIAPIMFMRKPKVAVATQRVGIMDDVFNDREIQGMMKARNELRKYRKKR
jgi:membrane-bound acyltransferase YfiQ involved in biofilm formation